MTYGSKKKQGSKLQKYLDYLIKKNKTYQMCTIPLMQQVKGNFISLNIYNRPKIKKKTLCFLNKQKGRKISTNKRNENKSGINSIKNGQTLNEINDIQSWYFEHITKIENFQLA